MKNRITGVVDNPDLNLGTIAAYHMANGIKAVSTYRVEWTINKLPSPIVKFKPDCGCTANVRQEGNKIIADFTPGALGTMTKGIDVFLDDNQPLFIKNDDDEDIHNYANKTHFRLTITGTYV